MRYIICYDIPDDKTRDNIVNYLERFAWRVQYSVFSCRLDTAQAALVWKDLLAIADPDKGDSVLMVPLCKSCEKNLLLSVKPLEEEKGFLVV
ncbi:MAG: CRISPR-associated endonuclease Cas2 [Selenomonadaceae bacterium]|nr:CRISPR-associated endonuclease Cas2 [Selenomonadaceae bacterium]